MKKLIILAIALVATIGLFAADQTFTLPTKTSFSLTSLTAEEIEAVTWSLQQYSADSEDSEDIFSSMWKSSDITQKFSYSTTNSSQNGEKITVSKNIQNDVVISFQDPGVPANHTKATDGSYGSQTENKVLNNTTHSIDILTGIKSCTVNDRPITYNIGFLKQQSLTLTYTISNPTE